jgi:hypothetical protein
VLPIDRLLRLRRDGKFSTNQSGTPLTEPNPDPDDSGSDSARLDNKSSSAVFDYRARYRFDLICGDVDHVGRTETAKPVNDRMTTTTMSATTMTTTKLTASEAEPWSKVTSQRRRKCLEAEVCARASRIAVFGYNSGKARCCTLQDRLLATLYATLNNLKP